MSDCLRLMNAFGIASLDSFSCNFNANRSVVLSNRRFVCVSHLDRFEMAVFFIKLCLFEHNIEEAGGGFTAACLRRLYRSQKERGQPHGANRQNPRENRNSET